MFTLLDQLLDYEDFMRLGMKRANFSAEERWEFNKDGDTGVLEIDLPGVKKEDVSLEVGDGRLEIKWKKKGINRSRSFKLSPEYGEEVTAKMEDGILEIRMAYSSKRKKIEIV